METRKPLERTAHVGTVVLALVRIAGRCEGVGRLNAAKLLRATAHSLTMRAAADENGTTPSERLDTELRAIADDVQQLGVDERIVEGLRRAARLIREGGALPHSAFPDPFVCRRCGCLRPEPEPDRCPTCGAHGLTYRRHRPVYWLTAFDPAELLVRLEGTPELFAKALGRLPQNRLEWKPEGTPWHATDVINHVLDSESLLNQRTTQILQQTDPPLVYRPEKRPIVDGSGTSRCLHLFERYRESRARTLASLHAIGPASWKRCGRHFELGRVTLQEQASFFAAHELTHLRQLEGLRRDLTTD